MRKIHEIGLLDLLPESILLDTKLKASARALEFQLKKVTEDIKQVLHIPRLDELSGTILDYLAEQVHCDFYEPLWLSDAEKRNLIRESIAWHRIKGTRYAVEKIAHDAFRDVDIKEWFEYGGEPFHFKISSHGFKKTPDNWSTFVRMVDAAKNVRSWVDNYELILDDTDLGILRPFAGVANLITGHKQIEPAKPDLNYRTSAFAQNVDFIFGNVTESLRKPKLNFEVGAFAGMMTHRIGNIKFNSSTRPADDSSRIAESWTSKIFAGVGNGILGVKKIGLARPKDESTRSFAGNVDLVNGILTVKPDTTLKLKYGTNLQAGTVLTRVGNVKIGTSTAPSTDENYFAKSYSARITAAQVTHQSGSIKIKDSTTRSFSHKTVVRVGQVNTVSGFITIGCADLEDWSSEFLYGDWLRLRFRFPNLGKRFISLRDPKDDLEKSEISLVGAAAAGDEILINRDGETTTGIDLAMLIKRSTRTIF